MITDPGVYQMSAADYHRDPVMGGSLSSSGARKLLPPSCPALFQHWLTAGEKRTDAFDFGHAAHRVILGDGADLVVIDADSWRTKAAQNDRADAYLAGKTALLVKDYAKVLEMARAIREHPDAGKLLVPGTGRAEQVLVWADEPARNTEGPRVWRRAMIDWLPNPTNGRLIVVDYKTAECADGDEFARSAVDYGYHQQEAWYLDAVEACGLADDPAFLFVVQEKKPPYLVNVIELDVVALRIGRYLNREAIELYRRCSAENRWPGYSDDVQLVSLPGWYETRYEDIR